MYLTPVVPMYYITIWGADFILLCDEYEWAWVEMSVVLPIYLSKPMYYLIAKFMRKACKFCSQTPNWRLNIPQIRSLIRISSSNGDWVIKFCSNVLDLAVGFWTCDSKIVERCPAKIKYGFTICLKLGSFLLIYPFDHENNLLK